MAEADLTKPVKIPRQIMKVNTYRQIIDACLRRTAAGYMSNKQCDTMVKACKAGIEAFVAEQYLRQIGMDEVIEGGPAQLSSPDDKLIDVAVIEAVDVTAKDLW